jgi:hypothetical protein
LLDVFVELCGPTTVRVPQAWLSGGNGDMPVEFVTMRVSVMLVQFELVLFCLRPTNAHTLRLPGGTAS